MIANVKYNGFLDLRDTSNYEKLSKYNAMLFPTYWHGEGCPGIVIDAYMAGIPILASDWNLNKDYVQDGITGILFPPNNSDALFTVMKNCIDGKINLDELSKGTQQKLHYFDINTVLSEFNLKTAGILD